MKTAIEPSLERAVRKDGTVYGPMSHLFDRLDSHRPKDDILLRWACPVPYFGWLTSARVATVGINPSNREFVDEVGHELTGAARRLPTLQALGITRWSHATGDDVRKVTRSCERYFETNPYRLWFGVLDRMLSGGGASFFDGTACHLDLVAFATRIKWGMVGRSTQRHLVEIGRRSMAELVRDSSIQVLVLNGRSVVSEFERFAGTELQPSEVDEWMLPRVSGRAVPGISYEGSVSSIGGIDLDREVKIIGYNHNLQSSFGVTSTVIQHIGVRVGEVIVSATAY